MAGDASYRGGKCSQRAEGPGLQDPKTLVLPFLPQKEAQPAPPRPREFATSEVQLKEVTESGRGSLRGWVGQRRGCYLGR